MMQSIAIKAYFAQMRNFFTRQGFDKSMKVAYGADAEGPQRLLDQDLADKKMDRKSETNRDTVREDPYSYLFWTRDSLENIVRRSIRIADGMTPDGKLRFKKTVSASFGMGCVLVSNKAELIEDFSEAFAAEYQNLHNVPINLKFAYDDRRTPSEGGYDTLGLNATIIQDLGKEELVSFRQGNLFSYSWNVKVFLNFVSEFADWKMAPLRKIIVDAYNLNSLYSSKGVPLSEMEFKEGKIPVSSMDYAKPLQFRDEEHGYEKIDPEYGTIIGMAHNLNEKDSKDLRDMVILRGDYTANDGTVVKDVPADAFVEVEKP